MVDAKVDISSLVHGPPLYATHIQMDEIRKTPHKGRRVQLEQLLSEIPQESVLTESETWEVSRWGRFKWSHGKLLSEIRGLIPLSRELVLVTHDRHLFRAVTEFGGAACNLEHLLRLA
jgi:hypothetical protein